MVPTVVMAVILAGLPASSAPFEQNFQDATLRFDYYHTGTRREETISLDAFRLESGGWAGSKSHLIDTLGWGRFRLRLEDAGSGEALFTRTYSTLFGEWQTTSEAENGVHRTFHESVLMPLPLRPAVVVLESRQPDNTFLKIFETRLDPGSHLIAHSNPHPGAEVMEIEVNGPPSSKVDILFLPDGYSEAEAEKYRRDVRRFTERLFSFPPFTGNRNRFNVRAIEMFTEDSGISEPRKGIWRDSPSGSTFNTFDIERYVTVVDNRRMRDLATGVPYDRLMIIVNSSRYGGGGIHDFFAVFTSDNEYSGYVAVHEFGHAFAGLGDEYYTSAVAYNEFYPRGVEPWEANITALVPDGHPKWEPMLTPDVPVPTPPEGRYADVVGVFEGAGYAAEGLYRPALDCQMFSKGDQPFDPVCSDAIVRVIDFYAD